MPGEEVERDFVLYDNFEKDAGTVTVSSLWNGDGAPPKSYLTSTFGIIPDTKWLSYNEKIQTTPDGTATVSVRACVPQGKEHYGKKWEDILMLYVDERPAGFVRVQIETADKEGGE